MKIMIGKSQANTFHLRILAWLLTMPVFIDCLNVFVNQFHLGNTTIYTAAFYVLTLLVILVRGHIYVDDLLCLVLCYVPFLINYLFFLETRHYLTRNEMLMIYIFYIPFCVFSVRKIKQWDGFFDMMIPFAVCAILFGAALLLFLNYSKYLVYMDFSYALLPSICALYHRARCSMKSETEGLRIIKKLGYFILSAVGLVEIIIFGARAPILFAVFYVVAFEILRSDKQLWTKLIFFLAVIAAVGLLLLYQEQILAWIGQIGLFGGSRFLTKVISGKFFQSPGRDYIAVYCKDRIMTMGGAISGFFGDRAYVGGQAYPHNIVYELLMSWGWGIGLVIIVWLASIAVRALRWRGVKRDAALFILVSLVARYFVSGSYIQEGRFWIALFALIALCSTNKQSSYAVEDEKQKSVM